MKYKVRWLELIEYEVEVEVDSRKDAFDEAIFQSNKEGIDPYANDLYRTSWGQVETDSIEIEELPRKTSLGRGE